MVCSRGEVWLTHSKTDLLQPESQSGKSPNSQEQERRTSKRDSTCVQATEVCGFTKGQIRGGSRGQTASTTGNQCGEECWKVLHAAVELSGEEQRVGAAYILRWTGAGGWGWLQWSRAGLCLCYWLGREWVIMLPSGWNGETGGDSTANCDSIWLRYRDCKGHRI